MIIAFIIWSFCALLFLGTAIACRRAKQAVGFFTFVAAPAVRDVKRYNRAVSRLWLVSAAIFELLGIPFLYLEQNASQFVFIVPAVMFLVIGMMLAYLRIEAAHKP